MDLEYVIFFRSIIPGWSIRHLHEERDVFSEYRTDTEKKIYVLICEQIARLN